MQAVVGANFRPVKYGKGGLGRLLVTVYSCPQSSVAGQGDTGDHYAVVTVPIEKDGAPIAFAGMEDAEWSSLALYVGSESEELYRFIRESAFAALGGESRLFRQSAGEDERVTAQVAFADGELRISALFSCEPAPFRRNWIAVGTGSMKYALVFGEMAGRQCDSTRVSVKATGDTPLSDLELTADRAIARKATDVTFNLKVLSDAAF